MLKLSQRFYRYEPNGKQLVQIFPIPEIHLDLRRSKSPTDLIVLELFKESSGVIKCEVSAENTFLTVSRTQLMTVLSNCAKAITLGHILVMVAFTSFIIA